MLVSGQSKIYLCTTCKQPSGMLTCAVGALVRAVSYGRRLAGCQLSVRRTGRRNDPVMDRR